MTSPKPLQARAFEVSAVDLDPVLQRLAQSSWAFGVNVAVHHLGARNFMIVVTGESPAGLEHLLRAAQP
jgi:hypothetical protein